MFDQVMSIFCAHRMAIFVILCPLLCAAGCAINSMVVVGIIVKNWLDEEEISVLNQVAS